MFGMNLLSSQSAGIGYAAILLLMCIVAVHGFRLAKIGYRSLKKKLPPSPPPKQEKKQEPVYFIVERRKKRSRAEYSEPKRIDFRE